MILAFAIGEYRYGWLQRDGRGGWGLVDTRTDPTLDLYGWDQVADRIKQLGPARRSAARSSSPATGIKVPISPTPWAASSPSSVTTPTIRAGSHSGAGPRNGSVAMESWSWSARSKRGRGISGVGFGSVEPVSDFWVERNGKPVRRIQLYRCLQQRVAFPFAMDRAERLARSLDGKRRNSTARSTLKA